MKNSRLLILWLISIICAPGLIAQSLNKSNHARLEKLKNSIHYYKMQERLLERGLSENEIDEILLRRIERDPELAKFLLNDSEQTKVKSKINLYLAKGKQATGVVNFPDSNIEQVVRNALGKPSGDITNADMATLTSLESRNNPGITRSTAMQKTGNAFDGMTSEDILWDGTCGGSPGEGIFTRITEGPIVNDGGSSIGCSWADYNNDGNVDLFVANTNGENNFLYLNNGEGTFTKITSGNIVTDGEGSTGCSWGDYDNDGYLDLFLTNYYSQKHFLYHNNCNGTFTNIHFPFFDDTDYELFYSPEGCSWGDYDNDGYLDLFVTDSYIFLSNFLFRNNGEGTFTKITNGIIVNDGGRSVGCNWGDYNNDGDLDMFVTNTKYDCNFLYQNNGDGTFSKITSADIVTDWGYGFYGSSWGDYDNDGDLDLFVTGSDWLTGYNFFYQNNGDGTFTKITGGNIIKDEGSIGSSWGDYDNDGDLDLFVANYSRANSLYQNNGDGTFNKITTGNIVTDGGNSCGCSWVDYDNDGDLDLFVANAGGNNFLYQNNGNENFWISIKCIGMVSNKSAIGAKVKVNATIYGDDIWQIREISGQTGYSSQNSLNAEFGLGDATVIDSVKVEWPSSIVQILTNIAVNQFLTITEPCGITIEAEEMQNRIPRYGSPCADGWKLTHENHPIYEDIEIVANSKYHFKITAKGEIAGSAAPWMKVEIGNIFKGCCEVNSTEWAEYSFAASVPAGTHRLSLTFLNDWWNRYVGDRNLLLDKVEINFQTEQVADTCFTFEAENMRCQHPQNYQDENYIVLQRPYAFVGQEMFFENHGDKELAFVIYAKGDSVAGGWPQMELRIGEKGKERVGASVSVADTKCIAYIFNLDSIKSGEHRIKITYHSESWAFGRNLYIDKLVIIAPDGGLLKPGDEPLIDEPATADIPKRFALDQNYPNPFNPETYINYQLPEDSYVVIKIFNTLGQEIKTLINESKSAGYYTAHWNGLDNSNNQVVSGIYLYQIQVGSYTYTRKMALMK